MSNYVDGLFIGEIKPTKILAGCVAVFENAWPSTEETIRQLEVEVENKDSAMVWERARVLKEDEQARRTNYDLGLTNYAKAGNGLAMDINNQMFILLSSALSFYNNYYGVDAVYHEKYNILKYSTGQEYKAHPDGDTALGRAVSAIVYLNDDYEGGELEFVNFDLKIKPSSGSLFLFPSTYPYTHIAHPVTSGTKYAIVTWVKDRFI